MNLKPVSTEKAVMMIESQNVLVFKVEKTFSKDEIRKEVEEILDVKVDSIRTQVRDNQKIAYVKLNKKNLAIDVATKMGLM